jgi:hypothetical protein
MEFLAEDMFAPEPSDEQLAAYLASNPERFRTEDQITFHQVFLSATRRANTIESDSKQVGSVLARADGALDVTALGDPFLLGEEFRVVSLRDTAGTFGESFARQVFAAEPGQWQGPIASTYGLHFIFINERTRGSVSPLDAVRPAVIREWANVRRLEAERNLYRTLRDQYEIIVEIVPPQAAAAERP